MLVKPSLVLRNRSPFKLVSVKKLLQGHRNFFHNPKRRRKLGLRNGLRLESRKWPTLSLSLSPLPQSPPHPPSPHLSHLALSSSHMKKLTLTFWVQIPGEDSHWLSLAQVVSPGLVNCGQGAGIMRHKHGCQDPHLWCGKADSQGNGLTHGLCRYP